MKSELCWNVFLVPDHSGHSESDLLTMLPLLFCVNSALMLWQCHVYHVTVSLSFLLMTQILGHCHH